MTAAFAFRLGWSEALETLSVQQITPNEAAVAMANDEFYSDYNEATLLIHGSVTSVMMSGSSATVGFATSGTSVECQLNQLPITAKIGAMITVIAEGSQAQRLSSGGVLLNDCIQITP